MSKSNEEKRHEDGQKDYKQEKYDPPPGDIYTPFKKYEKSDKERYNEGYRNSRDQDNSDSLCFLSTACIQAKGLPDDCAELMLLRDFRDNYLLKFDEGKKMIREYYQTAPRIVEQIGKSINPKLIYKNLYKKLVIPSIELIKSGNEEKAVSHYKGIVENLRVEFLIDSEKK